MTRKIRARGSIRPFQVSTPRHFEKAEAKTRKHQTIRKRTEPAFIEPMQCKPVTALPSDKQWTFEIKFDGYRCIAVNRGNEITLFSRNEKVLNKRFPDVARHSHRLEVISFSTENWSPWIRKENLHFMFCKAVYRRIFRLNAVVNC
jgi:hypothetical protein